jgi:PAS domain-containing protein
VQANGRDTNELAQEFIRAAFAKGSAKFEWLYLRGDGRPITVQVLFTAIRRGDRQLLHVVWSDITAQQQLERELAEHRTQLEQKVAQRTAELRS